MAAAIPVAIEGLTAVIALAAAGAAAGAVASTLVRVPETTHWNGPSIFNFGSGGGSGGLRPRPPKRPPHSKKKKIMAALLAGMMAKYLEKKGPTSNSNRAGEPLVDGFLGYNSVVRIDIRLKDKHEWCGHFKKGPSQNVPREVEGKAPEEDLKLVHQGTPPQGSKAGLAYAANGTQWIVAWHASLNSNPKIYVECGDEGRIDWSRIEKKLDASCNESDCEGAMAQIISNGRDAAIFVVFST